MELSTVFIIVTFSLLTPYQAWHHQLTGDPASNTRRSKAGYTFALNNSYSSRVGLRKGGGSVADLYGFPGKMRLQFPPLGSASPTYLVCLHIPPFFNYVKMRFQICGEVNIRTNVTSYCRVDKYLCFGGTCCLQLQGRRDFNLFYSENGDSTKTLRRINQPTRCHISEDSNHNT